MMVEPNDPTVSGTVVPPAAGAVQLSRNETESLCLKAARGAGMSWGLAEEAGFAAGWLSARGIDGASAILAQLDRVDGLDRSAMRPVLVDGAWRANGVAPICPIWLGAALSDFTQIAESGQGDPGISCAPVSRPLLILPFLSGIAKAARRSVRAEWQGGAVVLSADGDVGGDVVKLASVAEAELTISCAEDATAVPFDKGPAPVIAKATISALSAYAMRTTVPASDASRADAGAAESDND